MSAVHEAIRRKVSMIFASLAGDRLDRLEPSHVPKFTSESIAAAFRSEYGNVADDIGFHVADWNSDAAFIVALHLFPERFTQKEIEAGVRGILIHAPNHLAAAAKLAGYPVEDIFGVGALNGVEDA